MPSHIAGKKHQARLQSASSSAEARSPCFYWAQGKCFKGKTCQYAHVGLPNLATAANTVAGEPVELVSKDKIPTPARAIDQRPFLQGSITLSREFLMKKQVVEGGDASKPTYPEKYRDLLKRKRDVNLYISGGRVVWQFAFNEEVKDAIKTYIKGRIWDKSVGPKGSWTCPIESLPAAIALYEHLGRTPDVQLKQRCNDMVKAGGWSSAIDSVRLAVELIQPKIENAVAIGRARVSFQYDVDLVAAIKRLAPPCRSYDPHCRDWTVDLLSLPELLHEFKELGYAPCSSLKSIATLLDTIDRQFAEVSSRSIQPEQPLESVVEQPGASDEERNTQRLEVMVKELRSLLRRVPQTSPDVAMDSSDCGAPKRRRLTSQQMLYSLGEAGCHDALTNSDSELDDFIDLSWIQGVTRTLKLQLDSAARSPSMCSCGQPWRRTNGKHVCRFFGYFECRCGNRWTSAYCWDGEMQACRSCNTESFPHKKEQLDGRIGKGTGPHDSSRCSMCARLGRDCSERFEF